MAESLLEKRDRTQDPGGAGPLAEVQPDPEDGRTLEDMVVYARYYLAARYGVPVERVHVPVIDPTEWNRQLREAPRVGTGRRRGGRRGDSRRREKGG